MAGLVRLTSGSGWNRYEEAFSALANTANSAVVVVGFSSFNNDLYINYAAVPEPGSLLLVGLAGLGFAGYRRHKRRATGIREGELNDNAALVDPGIVE